MVTVLWKLVSGDGHTGVGFRAAYCAVRGVHANLATLIHTLLFFVVC